MSNSISDEPKVTLSEEKCLNVVIQSGINYIIAILVHESLDILLHKNKSLDVYTLGGLGTR